MKKKRSFFNRSISLLLVTALMAASLTGCGKKKGDDDSILAEASKGSKDYVYRSQLVDLGTDVSKDVRDMQLAGDRIAVTAYGERKFYIYTFNADGSDVKKITLPEGENEGYGDLCFDDEGNIYALISRYYWEDTDEYTEDAEESGAEEASEAEEPEESTEAVIEEVSEEASEETSEADTATDNTEEPEGKMLPNSLLDDSIGIAHADQDEAFLLKLDKEGNLITCTSLKDYMTDGYFSSSGIVYTNGKVVISSNFGLLSYSDSEGVKPLKEMEADDNELKGKSLYLNKGSDGKVYIMYYADGSGMELRTFDVDANKYSDPITIDFKAYTDYSLLEGNGYPLYASDDDAVYGIDIQNQKLVKLMDYLDSDIQVNYSLNDIVAVSENEFVALLPDEDYNYQLTRLTKVPADEVKDKKVITLGGYYIDYRVRSSAVAFNKESDEYKIKIVDYASYDTEDDWNAGANKFNLDIASGNVPDIMLFGEESPVDSYINKGLFLDLTELLNNDPDISESDFLPNIVEACKTGDKLYQLIPSFFVSTVMTKTKYLEGRKTMTFKDCNKLIKNIGAEYKYAFGVQQRSYFLQTGLALAGDKYIDWENKSCSFNSESFVEFLEFAKNLNEEYDEAAGEDFTESFYRDGRALFQLTYLQDFRSYKRYKKAVFGEDITFMGFPNAFDVNCSVIYPTDRIAISARTSSKEGAWTFVKNFLSEEYQDKLEYNFPVRKSSYDKMAEASMHRPYWVDGDKKEEYDDTYYIDDTEIIIEPLTQEEVQFVKDFIGSVKLVYNNNENVYKIIEEEASAFFSGQKSAQEVADIIQSRVSIYVHENS